jgi:flotillin
MKQKALQEAKTFNISETSKLKAEANIKEKEYERDTRVETSKMETSAIKVENSNKEAIFLSTMNLNLIKIESEKKTQQSNNQAMIETDIKKEEFLKTLETTRSLKEIEKLRASNLSATTVQAEMEIKKNEGLSTSIKIAADAEYYKQVKISEAYLFDQQKRAEGIFAIMDAQSKGLKILYESFNGNNESLLKYLMLEKGLFKEIAEQNSKALQNLQPKINYWVSDTNNNNNSLTELLKTGSQTLSTLYDQTGLTPKEIFLGKETSLHNKEIKEISNNDTNIKTSHKEKKDKN